MQPFQQARQLAATQRVGKEESGEPENTAPSRIRGD